MPPYSNTPSCDVVVRPHVAKDATPGNNNTIHNDPCIICEDRPSIWFGKCRVCNSLEAFESRYGRGLNMREEEEYGAEI